MAVTPHQRTGTLALVLPRHRTLVRATTGAVALLAVLLTACEPTPVPTRPGTQRVVVLGDSIPNWLIKDGASAVDPSTTTLVDGTLEACDGARNNPPARAVTGKIVPTPAACAKGWPSMYPPQVTVHADVAIVMTSTHAMLSHLLSGTWHHPCHGPARTWYANDMAARLTYLKGKADHVVVVLPAWPGTNSGWIMPKDSAARADCVRAAIRSAAKTAGATVIDFGAYLCPSGPSACKPWRTKDGMHVDAARAATVLDWVLTTARPATATQPATTTSTTATTSTTTTTSPTTTSTTTSTTTTSTTATAPPG